jgi:hypothetical protein
VFPSGRPLVHCLEVACPTDLVVVVVVVGRVLLARWELPFWRLVRLLLLSRPLWRRHHALLLS